MSEFVNALTGGLQAALGYQAIFFVLLAVGLNVHFGYTGLLNFSQMGFDLLGAFSVAVSVVRLDLPFWAAIFIGLGPGVLLALLLGIPTLRLRADYLAIV